MMGLEPLLESAAQVMSTFEPHNVEGDGTYMCQWPEQDAAYATANGHLHLGAGCKGCLIGAVAMFVIGETEWFLSLRNNNGDFRGEDARLIYMRTLELMPDNQRELLPRQSAEVVER